MAQRETEENVRILAHNEYVSNDTWKTRLNNNDVIIGPSGAGKTRSYVKPNIMQCNESMIIADTKGNLHRQLRPLLEEEGYRILVLDIKNLKNSCGYNPFDFIRFDHERKVYQEQDIITVSSALVPLDPLKDNPFFDMSARMYLSCLIGYSLECRPKSEHNLDCVYHLLNILSAKPEEFDTMMEKLNVLDKRSFAVRQYRLFRSNRTIENVHNTILAILGEKLSTLCFSNVVDLYTAENRIDFKRLGKEKTIVFLCISDTDRSLDRLTSLFYTQALQSLCNQADDTKGGRLRVPVRFIFDDFATNTFIEGFDNIISVIRSREIYVSVILQSITQLQGLYGIERSQTIINNFDHCLYLGGQDVVTAQYMSVKSEIPVVDILNMPLDKSYLFRRGSRAILVDRYNLNAHPNFHRIPESETAIDLPVYRRDSGRGGASSEERPYKERATGERASSEHPTGERTYSERPTEERTYSERPTGERIERPSGESRYGERGYGERSSVERTATTTRGEGEYPTGESASSGERPRKTKPLPWVRPSNQVTLPPKTSTTERPSGGERPTSSTPFGQIPPRRST